MIILCVHVVLILLELLIILVMHVVIPLLPLKYQTLCKVVRVRLTFGFEITSYRSRIFHNLQQHTIVLVSGGGEGLLGVRYHIVRKTLDVVGVKNRQQGRSKN